MEESNQIAALQEKDIQLVVSQETIGQLTTNVMEIKANVERALVKYDINNYSVEDIPKCKADKILLNKAAKALDDKRKELEKAWNKPFEEFKDTCKETCKLIKNAVSLIDGVIKEDEERAKNAKFEEIKRLAEKLGVESVGIELGRIFDNRWLNKSVSMRSIEKAITEKVETIKRDLETLKSFAEDYDALEVRYKENLNLQETILYANKQKERSEKSSAQDNASVTVAPKDATAPKWAQSEKETAGKMANEDADVADAFAAAMGEAVEAPIQTIEREYIVTGTDEMFEQLEAFMSGNGIKFKLR